jgi:Skp family chaperone for outer membrane proteins
MKLKLISLVALSLVTVSTFAATHGNNVATVNMKELSQASICKSPMVALQAKYKPQFEELQKQGMALKNKKDKADQDKLKTIEAKMQTLSKTAQSEAQKSDSDCMTSIKNATKKVADKNGYSLVAPNQVAIYAVESADITKQVETQLKTMDKK